MPIFDRGTTHSNPSQNNKHQCAFVTFEVDYQTACASTSYLTLALLQTGFLEGFQATSHNKEFYRTGKVTLVKVTPIKFISDVVYSLLMVLNLSVF